MQRNEKIEKQLAGHQVTKYVPSSWEKAQENEHNNVDDIYDSDSLDDSEESKDKSSEDEDPYADWFTDLSKLTLLS